MDRQAWDADDENENEEEVKDYMLHGRDGVIFLIDSTKPMFEHERNEKSPFRISLECCKTTMMNKIISSERDLIGVIFFGTQKKDNKLDVPHMSVLQDLQQPSAGKIKQLEIILKGNDFNDFENKFGHSDDYSLSDALWLCQNLFSTSQLKLNSQRILLFTNNDDPHKGSVNKQRRTRDKAKDLGQTDIDLELLHIGNTFNPDIFYKEVVQLVKEDDSDDWRIPNPSNKFDELLARVCRKDHKKRSMGKLHFTLGDGLKIGITVYNLVRPTKLPASIKLDRNTNEEVKSVTKKYDAETGALVLPSEISKYQEYAFRKIILTSDELVGLRKLADPGLKLLGFKPASKVKMHHHVRPSSFIYPEERLIQGSSKLFGALLKRCIERKVVPICVFTARANAYPALVALLPQEEVVDESNIQTLPPGFHLVYLPYSDDIRKLEIESQVKAEPEQVEKAKQIIRKLRFPYSPYQFDNPKLQTLWSNIEALALDHKEPREVIDTTVPDHEDMQKKLGQLSQEFLDMVYPAGYVPGGKQKASGERKRKTDTDTDKPKKVVKAVDADDMKERALSGKVEKLTVAELKKYLTEQNYKVGSMKKAELVTKVYEHLGIDQPN